MKEIQNKDFSEVTPQIEQLASLCIKNGGIDPELYKKYDVKRGLRDVSGQGVLTGLTEISQIQSYVVEDHEMVKTDKTKTHRLKIK